MATNANGEWDGGHSSRQVKSKTIIEAMEGSFGQQRPGQIPDSATSQVGVLTQPTKLLLLVLLLACGLWGVGALNNPPPFCFKKKEGGFVSMK